MTWVYRDGKLVEKEFASNPTRSGLPCPNIIRDGLPQPLQHMANGNFYDSKRAMEKANKEAGCECIGNEVPTLPDTSAPPSITKAEVAEAYAKVRDGYKPAPPIMKGVPKDSGWT